MARTVTRRAYGTLDERARDTLVRALAGEEAELPRPRPVSLRFFDTFDWRLWRRGLVLVRENHTFRLRERSSGRPLAEREDGHAFPPPFAGDWPRCDLRDRLVEATGIRALVHLVTLEGVVRGLEFTDPDSGRAWRLDLADLRVVRGGREYGFPHLVLLSPRDGREKGGKRLVRRLREAGLRPLPPTLLEPALHVARIRPAAYTGKIRVRLDPAGTAREAATALAGRLLDVMGDNLPGLRQDVDTEFLHDFRVAVRRTRTLLSLFRGVFPPAMRREFRDRFRELGSLTGPVREGDVLLLRRSGYRDLLPARYRPGLHELFTLATRLRAEAHRAMVGRIEEGTFQAVLQDWRAALEDEEAWREAPPDAARPVGPVAGAAIERVYARILASAEAMGTEPSARDLHRLRIACKKFRYALMFFDSLWEGSAADRFLATMKTLQDVLGEANDIVVQTADLEAWTAGTGRDRPTKAALRAAGALKDRLALRRAELLEDFGPVFAAFTSPKSAKRVRRLVRALG